jgi:H+/Cl- antiporter ClcA
MSSEGSQPETKKCPSCAEEIKVDAVKCHFCGAEFDPQVVTALVAERSATRDEGIRKISVEAARTSKWSFALGLFALLFPLAGLFAIIVGCVALARLRSSDNRRAKTFAILGAALGLAGLFMPPVIQTQFLELIQRLNP